MPLRFLIVLTIITLSPLNAAEKLLKPLPGPGTGDVAGGLRASIACVKKDFGPGESIVVIWKVINESEQAQTVELYRDTRYMFIAEIRRGGTIEESIPLRFKAIGKQHRIEPGESLSQIIDLLEFSFKDPALLKQAGTFEVAIRFNSAQLRSGWAAFRVTAAGEGRPEIAPEVAERVRSLIAQLGHNEFAVREQAYAQLREIGKPALGLLDEIATSGTDLEIVSRCKKLINEIRRENKPAPRPQPPPQIDPPLLRPPVIPAPRPAPPQPPPPGVKPPRPPETFEF